MSPYHLKPLSDRDDERWIPVGQTIHRGSTVSFVLSSEPKTEFRTWEVQTERRTHQPQTWVGLQRKVQTEGKKGRNKTPSTCDRDWLPSESLPNSGPQCWDFWIFHYQLGGLPYFIPCRILACFGAVETVECAHSQGPGLDWETAGRGPWTRKHHLWPRKKHCHQPSRF